MSRFFVLIPAAGVGTRMEATCPKQYLELLGKPVLCHSVEAFLACEEIERIYIIVSSEDTYLNASLSSCSSWNADRVRFMRCGGMTRRETVMNGLAVMDTDCAPDDWVLVHDAVRPGLTPMLIRRVINAASDGCDGCILALPVVDTVKKQTEYHVETLSREGLWLAQTPQMFPYALLKEALKKHKNVTDEASAIEAMGMTPHLVKGHLRNMKITYPSDLALVEMLMMTGCDIE